MGTLFEGFQILCTDYDHIFGKRGDFIQGRTLFKEIRCLSKQSTTFVAQLSIISSLRSNLLRAILIRFSGLLVSSNQFVTMLSLIVVLFNHGKLLG